MSKSITFAPPPWVTALLLRPPPPPPAAQPRTPPSPMRDLVAQWLVHVTDDSLTTDTRAPHVLARFRGWLAFVFRLPAFVRRNETSVPREPQQLPAARFTLIERSLYFTSAIKNQDSATNAEAPPPPERPKPKKKRAKIVKEVARAKPSFKLSPLYKSLYFSDAENDEQSGPPRCETPTVPDDLRDKLCVQSFFLTDATGEGKGILEGLREMKAQSTEPQRRRGWVPALVSLILIALNPLK